MSTDSRFDKIEAAIGDVAAPANAKDFDAVLESLIAEHGGPAAFSPSALAVARKVARLLTDDAGRLDTAGVSFPMTLLPAKTERPPWDLSVLTDEEFATLGKILAKVSGGGSVARARRRRRHRSRSPWESRVRHYDQVRLRAVHPCTRGLT